MAVSPTERDFYPSTKGRIDPIRVSGDRSLGYEAIPSDPANLLLLHPVYWGKGVPRGNGSPIMYIPPLFGGDVHMLPLRRWSNRNGFTAVKSGVDLNVGSWRLHRRKIKENLKRSVDKTGQLATIVGLSLGATYGFEEVIDESELVDTLITIAGVTRDNVRKSAHPLVGEIGRRVMSWDPEAEEMLESIPKATLPDEVRMYTISMSSDGVFPQNSFGDPRAEENILVPGKHITAGWNPLVWEHIGRIQGEKVVRSEKVREEFEKARERKILQSPVSRIA